MLDFFKDQDVATKCLILWDKLLREKDNVDTGEVKKVLLKRNPRFSQASVNKAIKTVRKWMQDELEDMGMSLIETVAEEDRRKKLTSYPAENKDPFHVARLEADFRRAIESKKAVKIAYSPSYYRHEEHIFHPQYLRTYNNRHFAYGEYEEDNSSRPFETLAIDRVVSIEPVQGIEYRGRERAFYIQQFHDVVGASPNFKDPTVYEVHILTFDQKTHMRMMTKPLHHSQKELRPYQQDVCPGKIQLNVQMKNELRATLLSFGAAIEVTQPQALRAELAKVARTLNKRYNPQPEE